MEINKFFSSKILLPSFVLSNAIGELGDVVDFDYIVSAALIKAKSLYNNNAYHNYEHAILVAHYILKNKDLYNLTNYELPFALVGAIFHDAMHSGTYSHPRADLENVKASQYYCLQFLQKYGIKNEAAINYALQTIKATAFYDGDFPNHVYLNSQAAIRDADLINAIHYKDQFRILENLKKEMHFCGSDIDFMFNHIKFMKKQKLFSDVANLKKEDYITIMYYTLKEKYGDDLYYMYKGR